MKSALKLHWLLTALISFAVYMTTIAPSVAHIDSGELAAVQKTLGIAHPSGYPLFTIVGYLFLLIPLPFSEIFKANLLASIWCSSAVAVFSIIVKYLLDNFICFETVNKTTSKKVSKKKLKKIKGPSREQTSEFQVQPAMPEEIKILIAAFSGLFLAFSLTFWRQSASVEVYSMHVFLIMTAIYFLLKARVEPETGGVYKSSKQWLIFAFALALSFGNHMITMLVLPATAYLFFDKNKFSEFSFKKIGAMLTVFLPTFVLIYSYLPIRASQSPAFNWGNTVNLENIIRHITGKDYQVWIKFFDESYKKQLALFFNLGPAEFVYIGLVPIALGAIYLFKKARKLFWFFALTFASTVLYAINYDINDIDSYFLLAFISAAFFGAFGLVKIFYWLKPGSKRTFIFSAVCSFLILTQIGVNRGKADLSDLYIFKDYTKTILSSVEPNSIIYGYQWDFFISPALYFQEVENFRKDVILIDKELLRRSWYYAKLEETHPFLLSKFKPTVEAFLNALRPFERGEQFDGQTLEKLFREILTKIIEFNCDKNIYLGPELIDNELKNGQLKLPQGCYYIPDIFMFKIVKSQEYHPAPNPDFTFRTPEKRGYYFDFAENTVGSVLVRRTLYEIDYGKIDRARIYYNKIKTDFPNFFKTGIGYDVRIHIEKHLSQK